LVARRAHDRGRHLPDNLHSVLSSTAARLHWRQLQLGALRARWCGARGERSRGDARALGGQVLRIDKAGKTRRIYVKRRDLLRANGLQPRDLRRIDPSLSLTKTAPNITVKEDVLLINLGGVRCAAPRLSTQHAWVRRRACALRAFSSLRRARLGAGGRGARPPQVCTTLAQLMLKNKRAALSGARWSSNMHARLSGARISRASHA